MSFKISPVKGRSSITFAGQSYFHHVGQNPLMYRNIGQEIEKSVEQCSNRTAFISVMENISMTFQEVKEEAETLAIRLGELGLQTGDHLGIWNLNTKQWYITWLASTLGGFPLACINPALRPSELAYCLQKAKVTALVTTKELGPIKFEAILQLLFRDNGREKFPELSFVLMQGQEIDNEISMNYDQLFNDPVRAEEIEKLYCELPYISPEAACNIQFTSGTTGQSKATILTHFNMVNLAHIYGRLMNLNMEEAKKICLPLPFFHVFGLSMAMMSLHFCNTLVLPFPFFKADVVLDISAKERCSAISGTPAMYVDFIQNQLKQKRSLDNLEFGLIGGSTVKPNLFLKIKEVLGIKDLRVGYGLSETTSGVVIHEGNEPEEKAAQTVGKPIEHCEAKIIDHDGETVFFGQPGELCLRGFFVMKGYFEDEEETHETITIDGWLKTGDVAIMEPDGVISFEGRKKNLIIRGGEIIFPKEIQNVLITHDSILEAQAIGVPDEHMGEEICVYLRLNPDKKPLAAAQVQAFCEGKLDKYKIPRYVRFVDKFPSTATGKIKKFKLKEMFLNEQLTKTKSKKLAA